MAPFYANRIRPDVLKYLIYNATVLNIDTDDLHFNPIQKEATALINDSETSNNKNQLLD